MSEMVIECPRCKRHLFVPLGQPDVDCNCHLYCEDGDKPSDCSVTIQNYSGPLKWPVGMDYNEADEGHDVLARTYYCSTHNKYTYKTPILLEADWDSWFSQRAPEKFRMHKGEI